MRDPQKFKRLTDVASAQFGVVSRADALEAGFDASQLRRLVTGGTIERVGPAVFRIAGSSPSWKQDVLAAVLDGGPFCVASHRTAAALHRLDGFRPDVVEVLVPMSVKYRRSRVIVHHTRSLSAIDCSRVGPIPVTSLARTLIDLGAVASHDRVEEAFDGAERDRSVARMHVEARHQELRARGRNGVGAMTKALERRLARDQIPRSVLERRMLRLLDRAGLPTPVVGHHVRLAPKAHYILDFAYPERRLGIEVDGHGTHALRGERAADNDRMNDLENAGWTIRRFTYEQVMYEP